MKVSKRVLLPLVLLLTMGFAGLGIALWTETLKIDPVTVSTGELKVRMSTDWSRPRWSSWSWSYPTYKQKLEYSADKITLTVQIGNMYPGAPVGFQFMIKNEGSIPAKIEDVRLENVKLDGVPVDPATLTWLQAGGTVYHLAAGTTYTLLWNTIYNWPYSGSPSYEPFKDVAKDGVNGIYDVLKDRVLGVGQRFDFGEENGDDGTMVIRVDPAAGNEIEGKTITFDIVFTFTQFNA